MNRMILLFVILLNVDAWAGWTPAVRISDELTAYEPRIICTGDTIHIAYWGGYPFESSYYLRSTDAGNTWEEPFLLADTNHLANSIIPVIRNQGWNIVVIWKYWPGTSLNNYALRRSSDGGENWMETIDILPSSWIQLEEHSFCISDSVIYLVYSHWDEEIIFEFMKSTDWGENWTESSEIFRADHVGPVDMAIRGDTIHFVWGGRFNSDEKWETYYIKSEDGGETWSGNILLSEADNHHSYWSVIAINPWGDIGVMWMDYKYTPYLWTGDLFIRYSYDSGDSWTYEEQLTFTHTAVSPRMVWEGDSIHVTWEDERYIQLDIYYMLSSDNGITWGEEQRVDDDPERSQTPAIGVSGENRFIVWGDHRLYVPGPGIYFSRWEPDVSVDESEQKPQNFGQSLKAYPNPFNDRTVIEYEVTEPSEIRIFNILGQMVYYKELETTNGSFVWNGNNLMGKSLTSGIYIYRIAGGDKSYVKKMVLLK
jgi:hypothetical protein